MAKPLKVQAKRGEEIRVRFKVPISGNAEMLLLALELGNRKPRVRGKMLILPAGARIWRRAKTLYFGLGGDLSCCIDNELVVSIRKTKKSK